MNGPPTDWDVTVVSNVAGSPGSVPVPIVKDPLAMGRLNAVTVTRTLVDRALNNHARSTKFVADPNLGELMVIVVPKLRAAMEK